LADSTTSLAATALEVAGVTLLGIEVYFAQAVERLEHKVAPVRRLQLLYEIQHYRGFWIEARIWKGDSPARAQEMSGVLSDELIEEAVHNEWAEASGSFAQSLARLDELTKPLVLKLRRLILPLGVLLIVSGLVLHEIA
jgi:hypothetical protein